MKKATVKITANAQLTFSKYYNVPKLNKELHDAYEKRTWRERLHYDENGTVIIPPMTFIRSIQEAAKHLNIQIPGQGKATYSKNFMRGVILAEPMILGIKKDDVRGVEVHVPSDGKRGGGKRVMKTFPTLSANQWGGIQEYIIIDDIITRDVFERVIKAAGQYIGILSFRPMNGGYSGRFIPEVIDWQESTG